MGRAGLLTRSMSASNAWFQALLAPFASTAESAARPTRPAWNEATVRAAAVPAPHTTPSVGASIVKGRTSPAIVFAFTATLYAGRIVVPRRGAATFAAHVLRSASGFRATAP